MEVAVFVMLGSILGLLKELIVAKTSSSKTTTVEGTNNKSVDKVNKEQEGECKKEQIEIETHL